MHPVIIFLEKINSFSFIIIGSKFIKIASTSWGEEANKTSSSTSSGLVVLKSPPFHGVKYYSHPLHLSRWRIRENKLFHLMGLRISQFLLLEIQTKFNNFAEKFFLSSTLWDGGPGKTSLSTSRGGGNRKCCGAKFSNILIIFRRNFLVLHFMRW